MDALTLKISLRFCSAKFDRIVSDMILSNLTDYYSQNQLSMNTAQKLEEGSLPKVGQSVSHVIEDMNR
jgi:hypothetical protein